MHVYTSAYPNKTLEILTTASCCVAVIEYGTGLPKVSFCAGTAGNVACQTYAVALTSLGVLVIVFTTPVGLRNSTSTSLVAYVQPHTKACLGACCSTLRSIA